MSHDPFDTQAAAYALGALDGEELAQFETHLAAGCARCQAILRDSRQALAALVRETPGAAPRHVKEALLERIAATGRAPTRRDDLRAAWLRWTVVTAAAMIVGGFLTGMYVAARYEARLGKIARETSALRAELRREEAALREGAALYQRVVELLQDPATRVIALRGAGPSPEARGRVVWHATAGGHVFVAKLPPAPEGKTYELWTITGGKPSPAGVFQVDATGRASHKVAPVGGPVEVFAITLEPVGGVAAPTGSIVLASSK
jgi:anti-sigma-K factor RskA